MPLNKETKPNLIVNKKKQDYLGWLKALKLLQTFKVLSNN